MVQTETLDCRGMACPNPVLKTRELIERGNPGRLSVLVDNAAARENVSRFLCRSGYSVDVTEENGFSQLVGVRSQSDACQVMEEVRPDRQETKILVFLGTDRLGRGDDELGQKLVVNFISTLKEMGAELWRLVLVNGGVKLSVEGSPVLGALKELEEAGVSLLVCGACLQHFGLMEKKRAGETTNMLDIVTAMQLADKVISLT